VRDVELKALDLYWLGDPLSDCCAHGGVYLRVGDRIVSDGKEKEWTLNTAAFHLLKTINRDYPMFGEEPLIPHCGQTMWVVDGEPDNLYLKGCDIGIRWSIRHCGDSIIHTFYGGHEVTVSRDEWKTAVCRFSDEVFAFFMAAWPKSIQDEMDRDGFELFMNLWTMYRSNACSV